MITATWSEVGAEQEKGKEMEMLRSREKPGSFALVLLKIVLFGTFGTERCTLKGSHFSCCPNFSATGKRLHKLYKQIESMCQKASKKWTWSNSAECDRFRWKIYFCALEAVVFSYLDCEAAVKDKCVCPHHTIWCIFRNSQANIQQTCMCAWFESVLCEAQDTDLEDV